MRATPKRLLAATAVGVTLLLLSAAPARAEEKMSGVVTKIDVAKDGKSAVATLKDDETAGLVPITVQDEVTLQKFERSVIQVGDDIKCRYEKKGKRSVATYFKKAGGC